MYVERLIRTGRGLAAVVLCAGLVSAATAAPVAHGGDEDEASAKEAATNEILATLSTRMQSLGEQLRQEMNVAESLATAREKWDLDDATANDLAVLLTQMRDMTASTAHGGDEARRDLETLLANAKTTLGEDCARWLEQKRATVETTANEMRELGGELAAAAMARREASVARTEEMRRAEKSAEESVRESYQDAIAKLRRSDPGASDDWQALIERSVDTEEIGRRVRESVAAAHAARAEAVERLREAVSSGDAAARYESLVEHARKLASEHQAAGSHHEALRELLHSQAARTRDMAAHHARAAEELARAFSERQRAQTDVAKELATKMAKAERERALTKRRGEKSDLDAARAEIDSLRRKIAELERRVESLRGGGHRNPGHGQNRDV